MGGKNKKITVQRVAPVIAKLVEKIEEVKLYAKGPGSLSSQIAKALIVPCDDQFVKRLVYLWKKGGLFAAVKVLMKGEESNSQPLKPKESLEAEVHSPSVTSTSPKLAEIEENGKCPGETVVCLENILFKIVNISGDGNCLFRCFAHHLFGNQDSYGCVRNSIVEFTIENWSEEVDMLNSTCPGNKYENPNHYRSIMGADREFGTDFEIGVFARLYQRNVTIYREIVHGEILKLQFLQCDEQNEHQPLNIMFTGEQRRGHWVVLEEIRDFRASQSDEVDAPETAVGLACSNLIPPRVASANPDANGVTLAKAVEQQDFDTDEQIGNFAAMQCDGMEEVEPATQTEVEFPSPLQTSPPSTNSDQGTSNFANQIEKENVDLQIAETSQQVEKSAIKELPAPCLEKRNEDSMQLTKQSAPKKAESTPAVESAHSLDKRTRRICYAKNDKNTSQGEDDVYSFSASSDNSDSTDSVGSDRRSQKRRKREPTMDVDKDGCILDEDWGTSDSEPETEKDTNTKESNGNKRKVYSKVIGQVDIVSAKLKNDLGHLHKPSIRDTIDKAMRYTLKCTCTLSFYGELRKNARDIVAYAKCKRNDHKQSFQFKICHWEKPIADLVVSSDAKIKVVHEKNLEAEVYPQVRGERRRQTLEILEASRPIDHLHDLQLKTDWALKDDGHNQYLCKLNTLQKIVSENNCKDRLTLKCPDYSDLAQLAVEHSYMKDPFLRFTGYPPLHAYMWTAEDLDVLDTQGVVILHMDATGSITRKSKYLCCKRIYYYSIVVKIGEETLSLVQVITAEHGVDSIGDFLRKYRHFVERQRKNWPLAEAIVVDWSWAMIIAIIREWNYMSVSEYLEATYKCCVAGEDDLKGKMSVKICFAHFMKIVSKTIHEKYSQYKGFKPLIMECMALLVLCRSLNDLTCVFKHVCTLLLSREGAKDSLTVLTNLSSKNAGLTKKTKYYEDLEADDEIHAIEIRDDDAIYRKSPYYRKYNSLKVSIQSELERQEEKKRMEGIEIILNDYYAPEFIEHLIRTWIPYVVFWSSIDLNAVDPKISRVSNALAESSHKTLKEVVLQNQTNLSAADGVRKFDARRQKIIGIINLNAKLKTTKTSCHKPKYPQKADDPFVVENWQKKKLKRKRDGGYTRATFLNSLRLKAESKNKQKKELEMKNMELENESLLFDNAELHPPLKFNDGESVANGAIADGVNTAALKVEDLAQSEEQCASFEKFFNGTIKTSSYYATSKSSFVTVCRHRTSKSLTVETFEVTAKQFSTLRSKMWIDGIIIDSFIAANIDEWNDVMFISTDETPRVLGVIEEKRTDKARKICRTTKQISGKLIMPYKKDSHWRLLVADAEKKLLTWLDPYNSCDDKNRAIAEFKNFISRRDPGTSFHDLKNVNWMVNEEFNGPSQPINDGHSCGVFVMYYAECLGSGKPFDTNFDPEAYRAECAYNLLLKSEDMAEVCLHCFARLGTAVSKCKICERKSHKSCVFKSDIDSDNENDTVRKDSSRKGTILDNYFICRLCRNSKKH